CTLSKKEGSLLEFFLRNYSQILPRTTLLTKVWGPYAEIEDGNLDNYIHFIRRRLKTVSTITTIKTHRGVGYRLEGPHE
ncbi:MAG TPA: DNA-binding response regulator, partial [Lachnospiraceae bacterium]|nr:DNA-binding response regulator [Lachnospiraceae bacterium]